jgi:DNA anti-recombination protein RmuC
MDGDRNSPATKGDLADLEERLTGSMRASQGELEGRLTGSMRELEERVTGSMRELEERLTESMRDIHTEMLKGFYGFTQTVQARFQEQDQTEISLKRRISTIEDRILEIEKRLNFPPNAA